MEAAAITVDEVLRAGRLLFGPQFETHGDWRPGLKRAFHRRALETHPDRAATLGRAPGELAREFQAVTDAFHTLSAFRGAPRPPHRHEPRTAAAPRPPPRPPPAERREAAPPPRAKRAESRRTAPPTPAPAAPGATAEAANAAPPSPRGAPGTTSARATPPPPPPPPRDAAPPHRARDTAPARPAPPAAPPEPAAARPPQSARETASASTRAASAPPPEAARDARQPAAAPPPPPPGARDGASTVAAEAPRPSAREAAPSGAVPPPPRAPHARTSREARAARREAARRQPWPVFPRRQLRFAEYLYYAGRVAFADVVQAVVWQRRQRPNLGDIAIAFGYLTPAQVSEILERRRQEARVGTLFAEFAVQAGFLTRYQQLVILGHQKGQQRLIGDFFVERGLIRPEEIPEIRRRIILHNATCLDVCA